VSLLQEFHSLLERGWQFAFPQARSRERAMEHAIASLCVFGRRTLSRSLSALGRSDCDWSADYKLFSRARWQAQRLFDPVIDEYLERYPKGPVVAAIDDTKLRKSGKKIPGACWQRDPLSPPFHVNLLYGLRFLQAALLFPHYQEGDHPPRGIPVRFQEAPPLKKPGKRASEAERQQYLQLRKVTNLSQQALAMLRCLRASIDQRGGSARSLLSVGDGSFANKTMFKSPLERTQLLARCRKDARLCFAAPAGQRRKYGQELFTPAQVRQQPERRWTKAWVYLGGQRRIVKYKEVTGVLWQIEVNHRDEKDILGVGQAQLRSQHSVPRQPALAVASYSLLLLAALRSFGPGRTADYLAQPKWRRNDSKRPSLLDLVTLLRMQSNEASVSRFLHQDFNKNLVLYADA
jgi:hypothetical protein